MDRDPKHIEGYRRAAKDAVEFLHERAEAFNDPHAKAILNSAAFSIGVHFAYVSKESWSDKRRALGGTRIPH